MDIEKTRKVIQDAFEELRQELTRLTAKADEAEGRAKHAEKSLTDSQQDADEAAEDPSEALATLFFHSNDGRSLIELAYGADPKRAATYLAYLGCDDIRGELEVKRALERAPESENEEPPKTKTEKELERVTRDLEDLEESTAAALTLLFGTTAGRALLERAFRADPQKSASDLNYLGGHRVRGEIEVKVGLEKLAPKAAPLPPAAPRSPAVIRFTPRG